jgi:hypothetical protein
MTESKRGAARQKHKLLKAHKHGGKTRPEGETIELRADQAERLRTHGIIE